MLKHNRKLVLLVTVFFMLACSIPVWQAQPKPTAVPRNVFQAPTPQIVLSDTVTPGPTATFTPIPSPTPVPDPEYLVLLSFDGGRPEYLDEAKIPNLRSLIDGGTFYSKAWSGALENNTPTGHTEMSTGSFPRRNGIPGYTWYDLATGEKYEPTTREAVLNGEMAAQVEKSGVPTLANLIKQRWPDGIVAVTGALKYYAVQGLGMGPTDFILYSEKISDNDGADVMRAVALPGHEPSKEVLQDPRMTAEVRGYGDNNAHSLRMATVIFDAYKPRALLVLLPDTDVLGHANGGRDKESVRNALEGADKVLGELMDAYRKAGIFDKTIWVVAADHGMNEKEQVIITKDLFKKLEYQTDQSDGISLPEVHLVDHGKASELAEAIAAQRVPGITGVYARAEKNGKIVFEPAPTTQNSIAPVLNDAYLYLLDTYSWQYSPDVVAMTNNGVVFDKTNNLEGGNHSVINWNSQHIMLAFSGPHVKAGNVSTTPARLVDILPTVAHLLGLPDANWDGVPLVDAMVNPLPADLAPFEAMHSHLAPLRDALEAAN